MRPVIWSDPLNLAHPLNSGIMRHYLLTPRVSGLTVRDLRCHQHATMVGMDPFANITGPEGRPGAWRNLKFSGSTSEYLTAASNDIHLLASGQKGTVIAWARCDTETTGAGGTNAKICGIPNEWDVAFHDYGTASGKVGPRFAYWGDNDESVQSDSIDVGEWAFLAWVIDAGSGVDTYVIQHGRMTKTSHASTNTSAPSDAFYIGRAGGGTSMNGLIGEVRIHKRKLREREIWDYYQLSKRFYGELFRRARAAVFRAPDVTITPSPASAVAGKADPNVVLGSVVVTPDAATTVARTVDPNVVLGSVVIVPSAAGAIARTVDPTVIAPEAPAAIAVGVLSAPAYRLRTLVSECPEWIDWLGLSGGVTAGNAAAARRRIWIPYLDVEDDPPRPCVVIQKVNVAFRQRSGGARVFLRPSAVLRLIVSDLARGTNPNESELDFGDRLEVLLRQLAERSGGDSELTGEPYLEITSISEENEPASPQVLAGHAAEFFDASYLLTWN